MLEERRSQYPGAQTKLESRYGIREPLTVVRTQVPVAASVGPVASPHAASASSSITARRFMDAIGIEKGFEPSSRRGIHRFLDVAPGHEHHVVVLQRLLELRTGEHVV